MYQLVVVVMQFCFAYPKNKSSIDKQPDQVTTPGVSKSIDYKVGSGWLKEEEANGVKVVMPTMVNGDSEGELAFTDLQVNTNSPSNASNETASSKLSGYTIPERNVNITVAYNPTPKSLYTSFDQLRSARPNCFISSIIRGDGQPVTPGFAVKTTEIKSPEEVTGVKSPSPEAWKVAIDTGSAINWTQSKPKVNSPITRNANESVNGKAFPNVNQLTDQLPGNSESTNHQQSTFSETSNKHSDELEAIQIVTKETIL